MYPSPYGYGYNNGFAALQTASIFSAVGLRVGIIGAIVLYTVFLKKSNEGKFTGFAGWLYEYLNFQKLSIEAVLKIVYIIVAVWVTFTAFGLISTSGFLAFIFTLVFGNLLVRIGFEFSMLTVKICKNIIEVNKKMTIINKKLSEKDDIKETVNEELKEEVFTEAKETVQEVSPAEEESIKPNVCPNCGTEVTEGNAFCGKCGTKL